VPADVASSTGQPKEACRLCGGTLADAFSTQVLGKYSVRYRKCNDCQSLQTEAPYWLPEAYAENLSSLDTGAAQRNLRNLAASYSVARIFGASKLLDLGGGDGLLCRLLRDTGLNCYVKDRYAVPTYAQGFDSPDFARPDMVTAFEVFEHLPNPATDLRDFFATQPQVVLVSTEVYAGQGPEWWYISAESGQHVFFYSRQGLLHIGEAFGYRVVLSGEFILFVRADADAAWRRVLASFMLKRRVCRWTAARLMLRAMPGVVADFHLRRQTPAQTVAGKVSKEESHEQVL
jgi:hypothetical protein